MEFGEFFIDAVALELRRSGQRVELSPQAVRLLLHLVERGGELVSRKELYALLWPTGATVDMDRALNTLVRQVRQAVGDTTLEPRYIRTYPRRGYRFLLAAPGPVAVTEAHPERSRTQWSRVRLGLAMSLIVLAIIASLRAWPTARRGDDSAVPAPAREAYRLGRHLLESPDLSRRAAAVPYLAEAARLAPASSRVRAYLADAQLWAGETGKAAAEAARALELDRREPHALLVSGLLALVQSWDWARAEALVRQAVRRQPDDAAYDVALAFVLSTAGRASEAVHWLDRARSLDPVTALIRADIGLMYLYTGQTRKAASACEEAVRLAPAASYAHMCAVYARATMGDLELARAHAREIVHLAGAPADVLGPDSVPPNIALEKYREWQARRFLADPASKSFGAVLAFAQAGRTDAALAALESLATRRDPGFVTITVDPRLATLREDPAFRRVAAPLVARGAGWPSS